MRFNSLLMLGSRVRAPAGSPDNISDTQTIVRDIFVLGLFLIFIITAEITLLPVRF